ncbi:unnamed protein product [Ilex paraguariensis]|uniref:Uncharacterized protein n=1 Tax=Ilex paraguariensis TaxID=185542 RepID=A0ABC8R5Y1_9AQUA
MHFQTIESQNPNLQLGSQQLPQFPKAKDFLGVLSESNKRLQLDAKDNSDYDIEVLTGHESEYIEMDLMLGVAELQTPEALAAAESAIAGYQPVVPLPASSSGTESEGTSDEETDDDDDDDNNATCSPEKLKRPKLTDGDPSSETLKDQQQKKRPKIVELS